MTRNSHDQARELIALGGTDREGLSDDQQRWLRTHLGECEACLLYAEAASGLVRTLRSLPFAADSGLVQATQMRVRMRARALQQRRERLAFVAWSCALVAASSLLTTPLIWGGFEYLGRWTGLASPVWQVGFVLFWVAPTLAASLLFLAHGTHLSGNGAPRG
jgi:hypothetical protein